MLCDAHTLCRWAPCLPHTNKRKHTLNRRRKHLFPANSTNFHIFILTKQTPFCVKCRWKYITSYSCTQRIRVTTNRTCYEINSTSSYILAVFFFFSILFLFRSCWCWPGVWVLIAWCGCLRFVHQFFFPPNTHTSTSASTHAQPIRSIQDL